MSTESKISPAEATTSDSKEPPASPLFTGSCLCGAVTYALDSPPLQTVLCHCLDCSKTSGSAFQYQAVFYKSSLRITSGEDDALKVYRNTKTDSGNVSDRHFCGSCGSQLYVTNQSVPVLVIIMAGTIDGKILDDLPKSEYYCKRKMGWTTDALMETTKFQAMT